MTDTKNPQGEPLGQLTFDNRLLAHLPADPNPENYPHQVERAAYSRVHPKHAPAPKLVAYAKEVAELLDLTPDECRSETFTQVFTGNQLLPGMDPHATCYGGHQFGHWAGQLGDGRAINLGDVKNKCGEHWTLQLKGAGPTPYSRTADGLAVLRSSVREFLCSEAMHHLGVPTTRALSLTLTGEQVQRDMFYDGNPQWEPGAVVCRVAPSFTRFGHFEIFTARGDTELLRQMVDFTVRNDFPELGEPGRDTYIAMLEEVCRRTARMIAHWMRVGFVHGVMNTDNMSILGLTIDYGPYGWLEGYDPDWTPNTTDAQGRRYRFGNQPQVALWNLAQLANALYPLVDEVEPLKAALDVYRTEYQSCSQRDAAAKLGLPEFRPDTDADLISDLQQVLQLTETDMTIFYRSLADFDARLEDTEDDRSDLELIDPVRPAYYQEPTQGQQQRIAQWLRRYRERLIQEKVLTGLDQESRQERMNRVNPKYVLRNYMAQQAIDAAEQGDFTEVHRLLELLRHPYDEQPEHHAYFARRPEWARQRAGCSMLSCSS
ncbi:YdiU family protein [Marinimicrobium sp. ABcell2]|uniref:protein adenylyltransferase SelO n=1 Tax=Marinimicrobium sp. ABcell2 TaxID=3069751 RepID=UPI0027B1F0D6|nr:YdiU family protein [Marinimicrobium sp. ABcell2]MDQ2075194.1 YdiU family protein [Marinimicrobium sp. ABcell2]